jgi:hypothetical protein
VNRSKAAPIVSRRLASALLACALALVAVPRAVASDNDVAAPKPKARSFNVRHPLPFRFGETLEYDVKFSRFPISANVGELTFSVLKPQGSDRHVRFEVSARSRGALVSLFGIKVNDVFTSLADREDLFVYSTIKNLHENDFHQRQEAVFDRQGQRVRYRVVDPTAPSDTSKAVERETRPWVQDIVSAIYFARTRKLKNVGREVRFPISDEGQTYDVGVELAGREQVKVEAGTFQTLKVEAKIFGGRFVRRDGQLFIWFTDDERRIPVKAVMKSDKGTATFVLTSLAEGKEAIVSAETVAAPAPSADESDE